MSLRLFRARIDPCKEQTKASRLHHPLRHRPSPLWITHSVSGEMMLLLRPSIRTSFIVCALFVRISA